MSIYPQLASEKTLSKVECQRLFHGRGHAYPGFEHINIDWLPPVVLVTLYQSVSDEWLAELVNMLRRDIPECRSVQVQYRFQPRAPFEVLWGEPVTDLVVEEHGLKYNIQLGRSQNVGLFLDMANGRQWVKENARDKKVLNLFAFTCGFSVAAIAGHAKSVLNVDNNSSVLKRGRENHRLNVHDMRSVNYDKLDIFKSFSRIKKRGPYGLIICDPPTLQKGSVNIRRDYPKIIRRIPQLSEPGGYILLCLNSPHLTEEFLQEMVAQECEDCQFVTDIKPPEVFKEAMEGKGLKTLVYQYLPN